MCDELEQMKNKLIALENLHFKFDVKRIDNSDVVIHENHMTEYARYNVDTYLLTPVNKDQRHKP